MRTYVHPVAGDTVLVHVPQTDDDLRTFMAWVRDANARGPVALDTETTGLRIFTPGYRLRTVQFGDAHNAYVIHWERGGRFQEAALYALRIIRQLVIHGAVFDWLVLDLHAGVPLESLTPKTIDTSIKAKLVDPRQPQEGGIGGKLKPVTAHYVDPDACDTQEDLTAVFRSLGLTKAAGWGGIHIDHPTYNLYAGLDCIYAHRVNTALDEAMTRAGVRPALIPYEHELARICAVMRRTGMLLDVDYVNGLRSTLRNDETAHATTAARYGVTSINSGKQVGAALIGMGEDMILPGHEFPERTAGGDLKVDKEVLLWLSDLDRDWQRIGARTPNPLANAVLHGKRAGKWCTTYVDTFLDEMDADGRVHPAIHTLAARTSRMSVTRPALQTLPSSDWVIRRAVVADPGDVHGSADFKAVELRVLAALADVKAMIEAILAGRDLHDATAGLVFGEGFTPPQRKLSKVVGLAKVFGGGATTVQRQTGAPLVDVQRAMTAYERIYPEVRSSSRAWQREARMNGFITRSATGRILPLDRDRAYAIVNYKCQSTARDLLGQALINADEAGLLPYMRLPIHDEILFTAPAREAEDVAREFVRCMTLTLKGVPIDASSQVGGRSWGSLYGADY